MELSDAISKADQILDEERFSPTVSYEIDPAEPGATLLQGLDRVAAIQELQQILSQWPRPVREGKRLWGFKSVNYDLLQTLLAQVSPKSRKPFFEKLLPRMRSECSCARPVRARAQWNSLASELPLVAEFCVRNGACQQFLGALSSAPPTPGLAVLLQHLGDMIALEFTVFSDGEYQQLDLCVHNFWELAQQLRDPVRRRGGTIQAGGQPLLVSTFLEQLRTLSAGVRDECRKARYLYLKGSLLEGLNIEINQDRAVVKGYLATLGFTENLSRSLDEAERLYREADSNFDLKASMGHLRSFLENLQNEALLPLQAKLGGTIPSGWGAGLCYLKQKQIISPAEERFAAGLYLLISDQAVHPLVAEREYARLARNVVIEYALLFLRNLEKLGLGKAS